MECKQSGGGRGAFWWGWWSHHPCLEMMCLNEMCVSLAGEATVWMSGMLPIWIYATFEWRVCLRIPVCVLNMSQGNITHLSLSHGRGRTTGPIQRTMVPRLHKHLLYTKIKIDTRIVEKSARLGSGKFLMVISKPVSVPSHSSTMGLTIAQKYNWEHRRKHSEFA